ncbi:hypothetical protein CQW23_07144 [Capsicum baccatum]|uniref:SHSP domain-containing protein n=1 Tax=Capsicum baccatum TaxID=33114 RepID=A0A2G2X5B9_CAPBA|nr:hypothetical protein CQW23_07144 [Capsicum baccatum]
MDKKGVHSPMNAKKSIVSDRDTASSVKMITDKELSNPLMDDTLSKSSFEDLEPKRFQWIFYVFNYQRAGWCQFGKKNLIYDCQLGKIAGIIRANDVNCLPRIAHDGWTGDAILYSYLHRYFFCLPTNASIPITLNVSEYEIFAVVPIKKMSTGSRFALIVLVNILNSGGAIKELKYETEEKSGLISMKCWIFNVVKFRMSTGMVALIAIKGATSSTHSPSTYGIHSKAFQFQAQANTPFAARETSTFTNVRINWKETPEAHIFKVDIPGIKKEEVKVEIEKEMILQINGERIREQGEKNDQWHHMERSSAKFLRRFRLPENTKTGEIKTAMEIGVLTETISKEKEKKPEVEAINIYG